MRNRSSPSEEVSGETVVNQRRAAIGIGDATDRCSGAAEGLPAPAEARTASVSGNGRQALRRRYRDISWLTTNYIRDEPIRAVLFAAAAGAVLMALVLQVREQRGR